MQASDAAAIAAIADKYRYNPLGYVERAYDWGNGDLKNMQMQAWQIDALGAMGDKLQAGDPVLMAFPGGHGCGKSAFFGWVADYFMMCWPGGRGQITANKEDQLKTKTWPEIRKWQKLSLIAPHMSEIQSRCIISKHISDWRIDWAVWSVANPAGYSGMHALNRSTLQILDEADGYPDQVWDAALGVTSGANTQHFLLAAANPATLNTRFHKICTEGSKKGYWYVKHIDVNKITFADRRFIDGIIAMYGKNSDIYRVRVLGEFPNSSLMGLFDIETVREAVGREFTNQNGAPVIWGLDPAHQGADASCLVQRQGANVYGIDRWYKLEGDELAVNIAAIYNMTDLKPDRIFIDCSGGWGNEVYSHLKRMVPPHLLARVNFAQRVKDPQFYNKKAEIYVKTHEWFKNGANIINDDQIVRDAENIEIASHISGTGLIIGSKAALKAAGESSPDALDALALTFSENVIKHSTLALLQRGRHSGTRNIGDFNFLEAL